MSRQCMTQWPKNFGFLYARRAANDGQIAQGIGLRKLGAAPASTPTTQFHVWVPSNYIHSVSHERLHKSGCIRWPPSPPSLFQDHTYFYLARNTPRVGVPKIYPTPYIFFCYSLRITGVPHFSSMTLHIEPDKLTPLPTDLLPEEAATLRENMQIAGDTAALLEGLREHSGHSPIEEAGLLDVRSSWEKTSAALPTEPEETDDQDSADEVFQAFAQKAKQQFEDAMAPETPVKRKPGRPRKYPLAEDTPANPPKLYQGNVAERIRTMLNEYNAHTVADVSEMRMVITNKLLDLSMCGDPRIEIKATEMLGKISDVGLFTEKTEITINYNSVADIDKAIKDKVRKMLAAHGASLAPIDIDIDMELGLKVPMVEVVEPAVPAEQTPKEPNAA